MKGRSSTISEGLRFIGKLYRCLLYTSAAVQALREAFPQSFAGMYVAEEMGAAEPEYAAGDVIDPQTQPAIEEKADVQQPVSSMPQPQMDAADDFFN